MVQPYPPTTHRRAEPPAPVTGGLRWRLPWHDIVRACRRDPGLVVADPGRPDPQPYQPETDSGGGPVISSTPPREARQGQEYSYQPKAYDAFADGFTWSLDNPSEGMRIDRHSGRLSWTPVAGGYVEVVLRARNLYGKTAVQHWTVCVRRKRRRVPSAPCPRYRAALSRRKAALQAGVGMRLCRPAHFVWQRNRPASRPLRCAAGPPGWLTAVALPLRL